MTGDNPFTEAFYRAQKELNHDGFVAWLCQAYGALTTNCRGSDAKHNLKAIQKAISELSKNKSYSKAGAEVERQN